MRTKNLNNKGVALVTVVLFFLVLVVLLGGVMFSSISNQGNAMLSKEHTSAYYTAESGLNLTIAKLQKFLTVDNNYSSIPSNQFATMKANLEAYLLTTLNGSSGTLSGMNPTGTYSIQITSVSEDQFRLRSIGTVNGVSRTIEGYFDYDTILAPLAKAIIAKGSITMANNATINGPIASLMQGTNPQINVHGCSIGEVYVPNINSPSVNVGSGSCNEKKTISGEVHFNDFTLPSVPAMANLVNVVNTNNTFTFPELTSGKEGYYIANLPSTPMTFDLGAGSSERVIKLVVGDVAASNGAYGVGAIQVIGSGKLMVLITVDNVDTSGNPKYYFSWGGNVNVGQTDMSKFQLVIRKGSGFGTNLPVFTIPNLNTFIGSILMDYVNLELGNMTFKGFIGTLGTSITTTSNAVVTGPMWIYAPYANVSLQSNSSISGSIMANSVNITSGGTVTYQSYTGSIPFELNLPIFMGGSMVPVGITFKFINFKEV